VTATKECRRRRSRMRRQRTGKRLELSPRDFEIFKLLDRYRYLRSSYLYAFVGGKSETRFKERLGDLYHDGGYLDRPREQWLLANCRYAPVVYTLSDSGQRMLREHRGASAEQPLLNEGRPGACRQFAHALMISEVLALFELGARRDPKLRFISWREILAKAPDATRAKPKPFAFRVSVSRLLSGDQATSLETTVEPDALFGLEYRQRDAMVYRFFALEADRGTMPIVRADRGQSSLVRKALGYRTVAAEQLFRTQLGVPNLVVLVLTLGVDRRDNFISALETIAGSSELFLCAPLSAVHTSAGTVHSVPMLLRGSWYRAGMKPTCIVE